MALKYYYDLMSQPARAVYIYLKLCNVPFEACPVALRKGEHFTEEFKTKLNRFQRVPFIHDNNFKLSESVAIVRYIAQKFNFNNNWYPKDLQQQAKVDEYLEWQHSNTRNFCATFFQKKWLIPALTGKEPDAKQLKKSEENMINCLNQIETIWLNNSPYVCGDKISVADIFAACEIEQPRIAGYDILAGRPILTNWLQRVRKECSPAYEEAHVILNKLAAKGGKAKL